MILVRHAELEAAGLCYGQSDVPTRINRGPAAKRVLSELRSGKKRAFNRIESSTSIRCASIADEIGHALGISVHQDQRLRELYFGTWENRSWEEIEASEPVAFAQWMQKWQTEAPPGGESTTDLTRRIRAWAEDTEPDTHTLVVSHAGPIRALMLEYGEVASWSDAFSHPIPHLLPIEIGRS